MSTQSETQTLWQQGALLELDITRLSNSGDGIGRWDSRVVFVPDTVPGDRVLVRLVRVKPTFAHGKVHQILQPSGDRIRPACIVADKCGGCQWQAIEYSVQLQAKQEQVVDALERIGGFSHPQVKAIIPSEPLGYRNKATYPLGLSANGQLQAGYYQKSSHRLVNLNQCPVQDERLNPLLAEVKHDLQARGWSVYQEKSHQGMLRHLGLRIGRCTGEQLLTLVTTTWDLPGLEDQAQIWMQRYPQLVGVGVNLNRDRTNVIFGSESRCIAGRPYLIDSLAGVEFQIGSTTFFQVNTAQAEALVNVILDGLDLQGHERLLDAYCGIGTLTLPLARRVQHAVGIEVHPDSITQAMQNAERNHIENVEFHVGRVEAWLPQWVAEGGDRPDVVVLDPPRKGCDPTVLEALKTVAPAQIAYMSCNPTTLARDLKILCENEAYRLIEVQSADFFPQTPHVECVAFLKK